MQQCLRAFDVSPKCNSEGFLLLNVGYNLKGRKRICGRWNIDEEEGICNYPLCGGVAAPRSHASHNHRNDQLHIIMTIKQVLYFCSSFFAQIKLKSG